MALSQRGILQAVTTAPCPSKPRYTCCSSQSWYQPLRAIDSDTFRRWLFGGIQDLGRPAVEELMLEWMNPLLTVEEMDRLVEWRLRVSI